VVTATMGKDKDTQDAAPQQQEQPKREVPEEVQDTKVRTPGEEPGEVKTREAKKPEGGPASVFPEPTGTDNGLPTTLKPSAQG